MEVHLLVQPLRHRTAVQVVLQLRHRHVQRQQPPPVVLDEADRSITVGRPSFSVTDLRHW
jgi:hypothetical protein